jgi:hypothetical protein
LICLIYVNLGLFDEFWWWTWYYPREYATLISWEDGMNVYFKSAFYPDGEKQGIWDVFKVLLFMIAAGCIAVFWKKDWRKIVFALGLFLFTAIAVTVGLSFYPHYFILAAPAWAFLAAITMTAIGDITTRLKIPVPRAVVAISLAVIVLLPSLSAEKKYFFQMTGNEVSRSKYGGNPFPESLVIAEHIRQNTSPEDEIAVFGSEPQIPFYAQRKNSTGFLYTYEMIADHPFVDSFQLQMINEVKTAMPKYVIFVGIKPSWIARRVNNLKTFIFTEAIAFINQNYEQVGIIDIGNELLADYCWEDLSTAQHECAPPMGEGNLSFLEKVWIGIYRRR